jgi:class 3 adenylate cyclase
MSVSAFLERMVQAGTRTANTAWDARRTKLVNGLALLTILLSLASIPVGILEGRLDALPINLATQVLIGSVILLNARGFPAAASTLLVGLCVGAVSAQVVLLGPSTGVHHWYIPIMLVPLYVFPARSTMSAMALSIASLGAYAAVSVEQHVTEPNGMSHASAEVLSALALLAIALHARHATIEAEGRIDAEASRADELLRNMLPESIAKRMLAGERPADRHADVTVLFADLVHFTELAEHLPADRVVAVLDRVFTTFDVLVQRHGCEKIKTIGDAYMVAAGVPEARADHVAVAARLALDMRAALRAIEAHEQLGLALRIGMHCGPVVAGVIGRKRFAYDLWSDVVNVAARMEQHGVAGGIQVTDVVAKRLQGAFVLRPRGSVEIKGKGSMTTWMLDDTRAGGTVDSIT